MGTETILREQALIFLGGIDNIRHGLDYFGNNQHELALKIKQFDSVIWGINSSCQDLKDSYLEVVPGWHRDILALNSLLGEKPLPTLEELTKECSDPLKRQHFIKTFIDIRRKIEKRTWKFPIQITDNPGKLASGLLIEGYGLLLEKRFRKRGLAKTFVLAFETTLLGKMLNLEGVSELFADTLGFMFEDRNSFPGGVRTILSNS